MFGFCGVHVVHRLGTCQRQMQYMYCISCLFVLLYTVMQMTYTSYYIIHIKHMVCPRCIMAVRGVLQDIGLIPISVELGTVSLSEKPDAGMLGQLRKGLEALGFELLDNPHAQLVEQIKNIIIELVHYGNEPLRVNLSDYLTDRLHRDYSGLSKLFSETTGTTIEKYFIAQKIERAKELLVYGELTLDEIADLLGYSGAAYLSTRFKQETGLTPGYFRKLKGHKRKGLDEV